MRTGTLPISADKNVRKVLTSSNLTSSLLNIVSTRTNMAVVVPNGCVRFACIVL